MSGLALALAVGIFTAPVAAAAPLIAPGIPRLAGVADVIMPRPIELSAAAGDAVELERLGTRLGPVRLLALARAAAARGQERPATVALKALGLSAALHPEVAMQALPGLVELLREQKAEKLVAATGEAATKLCAALARAPMCAAPDDDGCAFGLPGELRSELRGLPAGLLSLATDPAVLPTARSQSLTALATLPIALWRELAPRLSQLAVKTPPPVRDATLAALGVLAQAGHGQELVRLVIAPVDPPLSSAAAAELCAPLVPRKLPAKTTTPPSPPSAPPALPELVAGRVRALAAADQPLLQRQQVLDCLRVLGTPTDRTLIQSVLTTRPAPPKKPLKTK